MLNCVCLLAKTKRYSLSCDRWALVETQTAKKYENKQQFSLRITLNWYLRLMCVCPRHESRVSSMRNICRTLLRARIHVNISQHSDCSNSKTARKLYWWWIKLWQGPTLFSVGAGGGCWIFYSRIPNFLPLSRKPLNKAWKTISKSFRTPNK